MGCCQLLVVRTSEDVRNWWDYFGISPSFCCRLRGRKLCQMVPQASFELGMFEFPLSSSESDTISVHDGRDNSWRKYFMKRKPREVPVILYDL